MAIHRLKTWPEFFAAVVSEAKPFELRKDDREPRFEVGDELILEEWNPANETYTGNTARRVISYVARELPPMFGLREGYAILGFELPA